MQAIKNKDSEIEVLLRKELWKRGLHYRKNVKTIFGHPDIAFIGKKVRGIRVATKQELIDRIYKYFDEVNETPVVYHWKYKMEDFEPSIGVAN